MKKALCVIAMILCMSQAGFSQDKGTYKQTLTKLMEVTGSFTNYKVVVTNMLDMYKKQSADVPPEAWMQLEAKITGVAGPMLVDLLLPIYQKYVSEADLKSVIAFYESPAGKRFIASNPQILKESMDAGQQLGAKIGAEVEKSMLLEGKGAQTQQN